MTTEFCPLPRGGETGRGAEASLLLQEPFLRIDVHTGQHSDLEALSSHFQLLAPSRPTLPLLTPSLLGQSSHTGTLPPKPPNSHTTPLL